MEIANGSVVDFDLSYFGFDPAEVQKLAQELAPKRLLPIKSTESAIEKSFKLEQKKRISAERKLVLEKKQFAEERRRHNEILSEYVVLSEDNRSLKKENEKLRRDCSDIELLKAINKQHETCISKFVEDNKKLRSENTTYKLTLTNLKRDHQILVKKQKSKFVGYLKYCVEWGELAEKSGTLQFNRKVVLNRIKRFVEDFLDDGNNTCSSVDTGRASSLAASDDDKCLDSFFTPDSVYSNSSCGSPGADTSDLEKLKRLAHDYKLNECELSNLSDLSEINRSPLNVSTKCNDLHSNEIVRNYSREHYTTKGLDHIKIPSESKAVSCMLLDDRNIESNKKIYSSPIKSQIIDLPILPDTCNENGKNLTKDRTSLIENHAKPANNVDKAETSALISDSSQEIPVNTFTTPVKVPEKSVGTIDTSTSPIKFPVQLVETATSPIKLPVKLVDNSTSPIKYCRKLVENVDKTVQCLMLNDTKSIICNDDYKSLLKVKSTKSSTNKKAVSCLEENKIVKDAFINPLKNKSESVCTVEKAISCILLGDSKTVTHDVSTSPFKVQNDPPTAIKTMACSSSNVIDQNFAPLEEMSHDDEYVTESVCSNENITNNDNSISIQDQDINLNHQKYNEEIINKLGDDCSITTSSLNDEYVKESVCSTENITNNDDSVAIEDQDIDLSHQKFNEEIKSKLGDHCSNTANDLDKEVAVILEKCKIPKLISPISSSCSESQSREEESNKVNTGKKKRIANINSVPRNCSANQPNELKKETLRINKINSNINIDLNEKQIKRQVIQSSKLKKLDEKLFKHFTRSKTQNVSEEPISLASPNLPDFSLSSDESSSDELEGIRYVKTEQRVRNIEKNISNIDQKSRKKNIQAKR